MSSRIYALIKVFDKEEYADAFIEKGELFYRTLGAFKGIEDDEVRGDQFEAVTDWHQPDQISITISYKDAEGVEHSHLLKDLTDPVIMQNKGYDELNIYCMYAIKVPNFKESYETEEEKKHAEQKVRKLLQECFSVSEKALAFGKFSVVVYRINDFISKVKMAAEKNNVACWHKTVNYYDPDTFSGSFNGLDAAFSKRNCYQSQSEYRFVFESNELSGPKTISIGSLQELAFKVPTEDLDGLFEFQLAK